MELRHLRYFLAVAETGNFTRAAKQSFVAQSALSDQIARLEGDVGARLFHRTSRRVVLTPVGEALRPLATRIVAEVEHAESEMAAMTGLRSGRLRLGIIQSSAGPVDLIDLVSAFRGRHPDVELRVRSGASHDMASAVAHGELDLAIVALPPDDLPPSLTHHPIADDPMVAVLSHDTAAGAPDPMSLVDLLDRGPFIHFLPGSGIRTSVTAAFTRANLTVEAGFEVGTVTDMVRLAAAGLGVTVVPSTSARLEGAEPEGAEPRFAIRRLSDQGVVHPVGVAYVADRLSPTARAFLAILAAQDQPPR